MSFRDEIIKIFTDNTRPEVAYTDLYELICTISPHYTDWFSVIEILSILPACEHKDRLICDLICRIVTYRTYDMLQCKQQLTMSLCDLVTSTRRQNCYIVNSFGYHIGNEASRLLLSHGDTYRTHKDIKCKFGRAWYWNELPVILKEFRYRRADFWLLPDCGLEYTKTVFSVYKHEFITCVLSHWVVSRHCRRWLRSLVLYAVNDGASITYFNDNIAELINLFVRIDDGVGSWRNSLEVFRTLIQRGLNIFMRVRDISIFSILSSNPETKSVVRAFQETNLARCRPSSF